MSAVAHEKLHGLDRNRVLAVVEPILRAHGVEGVELVWRTERGEWVLDLTLELPGSRKPGEGITVELCSEISRDLSAALDVEDVIPQSYSLQVGSPGLDRALYVASDYERFAGLSARLKLKAPIGSEHVVRGTLRGLDASGRVLLETESGELGIELGNVENARLLFDFGSSGSSAGKPNKGGGRHPAKGRAPGARAQRGR
jgi:ribosome maturation factor RimP